MSMTCRLGAAALVLFGFGAVPEPAAARGGGRIGPVAASRGMPTMSHRHAVRSHGVWPGQAGHRRNGYRAASGFGWGGWPERQAVERVVEPRREAEPERIDRSAFANLPASTGIPYPPRPEPVLYRLEGPPGRLSVREERFGAAGSAARLLTVPRR